MPKYHVLYHELVTKYILVTAESKEQAEMLACEDRGVWLHLPETTSHHCLHVWDSSVPHLSHEEIHEVLTDAHALESAD